MIFSQIMRVFIGLGLMLTSINVLAHEQHHNNATYLGNEGVLISGAQTKVLFDPFFHKNFSIYQLVPEDIRQAIFQGKAPYDAIDFVVISHAHDDHFSANDMLTYLQKHPDVSLIAPTQAINKLKQENGFKALAKELLPRIYDVSLAYGDMPWSIKIAQTKISAVRIPHAGWPGRAEVENLVFSITLADGTTVTHMGDADADDDHYLPHKLYWRQVDSNTAFPPYWFFYSAEGRDILDEIIGAKQQIGIHVPVEIPQRLISSGKAYFSKPSQVVELSPKH